MRKGNVMKGKILFVGIMAVFAVLMSPLLWNPNIYYSLKVVFVR